MPICDLEICAVGYRQSISHRAFKGKWTWRKDYAAIFVAESVGEGRVNLLYSTWVSGKSFHLSFLSCLNFFGFNNDYSFHHAGISNHLSIVRHDAYFHLHILPYNPDCKPSCTERRHFTPSFTAYPFVSSLAPCNLFQECQGRETCIYLTSVGEMLTGL